MLTKGMKSSEFWVMIVMQVILLLNTAQVWSYMPTKWSGVTQALLVAAYGIARGMAKNETTTTTNNAVN